MFEGALPFLLRRVRDHFRLDGQPIKSRRLDRLNYSQVVRNAYLLTWSSKRRTFAVWQLSGGHISCCDLRIPAELGESCHAGLEIKATS
jgi:hypothetical protein